MRSTLAAAAVSLLFCGATAAGAQEIRILVVANTKTPADPGVKPSEAMAKVLIASLNRAIRDSAITTTDVFKLAAYVERAWQWDQADNLLVELEKARLGRGPDYAQIAELRKQRAASIVVILGQLPIVRHTVKGNPVEEKANVPGISTAYRDPPSPQNGFVFLSPPALVTFFGKNGRKALTHFFIHEIGHVLGADHDPEVRKADEVSVYSNGFNKTPTDKRDNRAYIHTIVGAHKWSSIMTYDFDNQEPIRFSNCKVQIDKVVDGKSYRFPTGKCAGKPGDADNAKTIRAVIPKVAAYSLSSGTTGVRAGTAPNSRRPPRSSRK